MRKKITRWRYLALCSALLAIGLSGSVGCSRGGAKAVRSANSHKKDYRKMLDRARARKEAKDGVFVLQSKVQQFQRDYGRLPEDLKELIARGYIDKLPSPPEGYEFRYVRELGNVGLARKVATPQDISEDANFNPDLLEK